MNIDSRFRVIIDDEKQEYSVKIKGFASDSSIIMQPHPETDRTQWDELKVKLSNQIETLKFLSVKRNFFSFFARIKGEVFFEDQGLVLYVKEIQVLQEPGPGQRILVDFETPVGILNKVQSSLSFC